MTRTVSKERGAGAAFAETRVARVTVHRNGALVVRTGRANPGESQVGGLPLLYASDSLRLRPASGVVRDLHEACRLEVTDAASGVPAHDAESARIALALEEMQEELRCVEARIRLLETFQPRKPPDRPPWPVPDPETLLDIQAFTSERLDELEERRAVLQRRARELRREATALVRVVDTDPAPPRFSRGIRFTLVGTDEPVSFELEYFVAAARWVPSYALDFSGGEARLRLDALVAQGTGEDWSGAVICVATADLARKRRSPR